MWGGSTNNWFALGAGTIIWGPRQTFWAPYVWLPTKDWGGSDTKNFLALHKESVGEKKFVAREDVAGQKTIFPRKL